MKLTSFLNYALRFLQLSATKFPKLGCVDEVEQAQRGCGGGVSLAPLEISTEKRITL